MKKQIITVSRRTDIPAFYADWFRKKLEAGFVLYPNPFSQKPVYVDLKPDNVKVFVFWTRNPKSLFKHLDYIDDKYGKNHYMHFTINGYPKILERKSPPIDYAISLAENLAKRYGDEYVQWRFDPIIISDIADKKFIINKFNYISERLTGITKRCYFSFVDLYNKTKRNLLTIEKKYNIKFYNPTIDEQIDLIKTLIDIAKQRNIKLYACTEDTIVNYIPELQRGHCVDIDLVNKICKDRTNNEYKISPTRPGCHCYESKDIGYYDSCAYGCIYCYANSNPEIAFKNSIEYMKKGFSMDKIQDFNRIYE